MNKQLGTVCFITSDDKVLLARIEYGIGDQKGNGIGGVVNESETLQQAVTREISEETELNVNLNDVELMGQIDLDTVVLSVFIARKWTGNQVIKDPSLKELRWFKFNEVPYHQMWAGNDKWLPKALKGQEFSYLEDHP